MALLSSLSFACFCIKPWGIIRKPAKAKLSPSFRAGAAGGAMQLTVTTDQDQIVTVDLDANDPVETLKAVLEAETGYPAAQQRLIHNGKELPASGQTLGGLGLQANDLLVLLRRPAAGAAPAAASAAQQQRQQQQGEPFNPDGSAKDPEALMQMLAGSPAQLASLPAGLQEAVRARDVGRFQSELRGMAEERRRAEEEQARFRRLAEEDPFNPEVQRRLMESIEQANVFENFDMALEHNPEAFSSVCMLYVKMEVNGFPLKAFVDSGAQMTIMSRLCAERCNLLRLMDRRWQGTAVGVGSAKILGRIHMAQLKCGDHFFPCSITVLDQDGMEFLFGLENLKRHQCCIDLKDNVLRFGSTGAALPFLPEHEIPQKERPQAMEGDQPSSAAAPAPAAPQPTAAPPSGSGGGLPAGWEDKVQRLQELGFSREMCVQALRSTGGREEEAAALLFGGF
ncbi:hypothetical protein ABPG77_003630 [Micractinium sp. CCAP 211/92]